MKETTISKKIQVALSSIGCRIFRNNVGTGWISNRKQIFTKNQIVEVNRGDVILRGARPLKSGLGEGSSDYIGWTPVKITSEMIGQTIAVFTAVEVKTKTGNVKESQINFINAVNKAGGKAFVARSPEEAIKEINETY